MVKVLETDISIIRGSTTILATSLAEIGRLKPETIIVKSETESRILCNEPITVTGTNRNTCHIKKYVLKVWGYEQ
jgi:hypothetical protein